MTRRPGLSLTEVLVALFIMGIGTIAVLTLFPLGALNMAQALRDDRTTQSSAQAGAFFRWYWQDAKDKPGIPAPVPPAPPLSRLEQNEFMFTAMDNPGMPGGVAIPQSGPPNTSGPPSYPIVVDPMGTEPRLGKGSQLFIGDNGNGSGLDQSSLGRRTLFQVSSIANNSSRQTLALRVCSLLDGLGYLPTGAANNNPSTTNQIDRDLRYNWLWVIRRPDNFQRFNVEMTVVVFDKRAHMFAPPGAETVHAPTFAQPMLPPSAAFPGGVPGQTRLTFTNPDVPKVQKGGWLMDATVTTFDASNNVFVPPAAPAGGPGTRAGVRNANFYRVVSVTDNGAGVDVELEVPLKQDTMDSGDQTLQANGQIVIQPGHRRFVYFSGAAEVFVHNDPVVAK